MDFEGAVGVIDDVEAEPTTSGPEEPALSSAARMLEVAAATAERLVNDAQGEAEALVSAARDRAEALSEAGRHEADQLAAELARAREEQATELDRARATALAGLGEEQAHLEARIATLRDTENHYRSELRDHLTRQLSLLDATRPDPPASVAD